MSETEHQILAELRALRIDLADLREGFEDLARRLLGPSDRQALGRLLPLVDAFMGESVWSGASLFIAALNANAAAGLRAELATWDTEIGGLRSFGNFLGRVRGSKSAGLHLIRLDDVGDRAGHLYVVKRVSSRSKPAPLVDA